MLQSGYAICHGIAFTDHHFWNSTSHRRLWLYHERNFLPPETFSVVDLRRRGFLAQEAVMQRRCSFTIALVAIAPGALCLTVPTISFAGPWHRRDVRYDGWDIRYDRQDLRGDWRDLHQDLR